jgi:hypothetical protein
VTDFGQRSVTRSAPNKITIKPRNYSMHSTKQESPSLKQKLVHEIRQLLFIAAYLASFFLVFKLYTRLVLAEYGVDYFAYGLTLLKALALAKIILTAEALHLGERFRERPLIVPTVYNTVVFAAFALVFEILEHIILGRFHGKTASGVLTEILDKGWPHLASMTLVVFVAFLPFFAFRETDRALGGTKLRDMFIKRRS